MSTPHDSSDERLLIEFEKPYVLAEAFPGRVNATEERRKCSICGQRSQALPASALTVIKHRHGAQPLGHLRLYCPEHLVGAREWSDAADGGGGGRKSGPVCRNCFVIVPVGTRVCDSCGEKAPF
jgi:RNA polymerase subunit RPABC4/transcription elongation factor Spt4